MNNSNYLNVFQSEEKAVHQALWLNFKYRITNTQYGIMTCPNSTYKVVDANLSEVMKKLFLDNVPMDYSKMSFDDIRYVRMDRNPLPHLEELFGIFSTVNGELLRYVLHTKIPVEKLIRFELASRGYDENHNWCGYEKAAEIWLQ